MLETISAREIDRYIFNKNYLLVDVRQPADYRKTHIRGRSVYLGNIFWKGYGDWEKRSRFCTVTEAV